MTAPKPWKVARTAAAPATSLASSSAATQTGGAKTPTPAPTVGQKLAAAAQTWLSGQFGTSTTATPSSTASNTMASDAPANAVADNSSTTGSAGAKPPPALKLSDKALDPTLVKSLEALPRRVNDQFEHLGDMVNFVLLGDQQQVQSALDAAGWHVADTDTRESVLKGVLETYQKKDYMTMPMSRLYLFGRVQDFGYEQGEAYAVVASRHHFRIWKTSFTWNGKQVWAGAGTHDIGFEKDQRNGKVTHKIDPAVDGERDHIGQTLQAADKTQSLTYYLPADPIKEERNATGGGYHSDGRLLVIVLK
jgi:LssY C-terminus